MTTPDPSAASAASSSPDPSAAAAANAAPAAASGQPTHVTKPEGLGYQPMTPGAPGEPDPAKPADTTPPDAAGMRAYLADKAKEVSLEGKSDADVAQLYADARAKESTVKAEWKLPDDQKEKPWAAKVKSEEDIYKQLDNLTALAGKKSIVPNLSDPNLSKEDKEAFFSQLRGKDATEYPIPENPAFATPAEMQPEVAKLFMENGVHPSQAEAIIKGYQDIGAKQVALQFDPEGFKSSMETAFGADWEKNTGAVRNTIKAMMNEADQKALDHIPNNMLGVVYRTLGNTISAVNETLKKYGAKESFAHLQAPGGQIAQTDVGSQRQTWRNELAALTMRPHTEAEKNTIIDKIAGSYSNDPRLNQS